MNRGGGPAQKEKLYKAQANNRERERTNEREGKNDQTREKC